MVILHATTTTKVKIDHTKRALLTHMLPPQMPVKYTKLLGGRECIICTPLPRCDGVEIQAVKLLLLEREKYISVLKKIKTNMIKWTNLRLTPIKFEI